jgi:predicted TIM-barrel fold metal-dependent hydrolase
MKKTPEKLWFADCNAMVGPWSYPLHSASVAALLAEMDYHNIRHALVYHSASWYHHMQAGNKLLLEEIAGHERLLPCWAVVGTATREQGDPTDVVRALHKNRVRAVRVFPKSHKFLLERWVLGDLCAALEEKQIPLLVHKEELDDNAANIYPVCRDFPKLPVVVTCSSYFHSRIFYALLEKCPNFHLDTSMFLVHGGIEDVVERFGAGRLLYGSHLPFTEAGPSMAAVLFAEIADKDKRAIAHENFQRLFKPGKDKK